MNESTRRKLHPFYLFFALVQTIQGFLPIILIAIVKGDSWWSELDWYWYAGGGLLAAAILLYGYMSWRRFGFWLEADRIIIRKGVLFRDEKTIYYARIHSVNVEQKLVHRLFGVAQVKIETPGGGNKADGILPALAIREANDIRDALRGRATGETPQPIGQGREAEQSAAGQVRANAVSAPSYAAEPANDAVFRLDAAQLMMAAATTMNFGLVAAFAAGLYSFADDFVQLLPDHFFENVVEDSASLMPDYFLIAIISLLGIFSAWILSIVLYTLKYSGFTASRSGKQIAISYGLLEKKTFLFDPKKVQAVIIKEGLMRQAMGYAQVSLQVISSDKNEQLMLHPYIKRSEIKWLLEAFVPRVRDFGAEGIAKAPSRAFLYYVRIELLLSLALCAAAIASFKTDALPSLVLPFIVIWWRRACFNAAGVKLDNGQLMIRRRLLARTTYFMRRPQTVVLRVSRSRAQQRKKLLSLSARVLGSPAPYRVACLEEQDIKRVWRWYSRRTANE